MELLLVQAAQTAPCMVQCLTRPHAALLGREAAEITALSSTWKPNMVAADVTQRPNLAKPKINAWNRQTARLYATPPKPGRHSLLATPVDQQINRKLFLFSSRIYSPNQLFTFFSLKWDQTSRKSHFVVVLKLNSLQSLMFSLRVSGNDNWHVPCVF